MGAALTIRGLRYRYRLREAWVMAVETLDLEAGEQVLLRGPSGTGKSTLLQLVAGLLELRPGQVEGSIRVGDVDPLALGGSARDRWRGRHVGMIFQTFQLLPEFTALDNVMLALHFAGERPAAQRERAAALLAELGIERVHAPCEELSVGQQQRVAVARAVACRPSLVLADEPTASLDEANADAAMGLIQETCRRQGAALLCASHDPAMERRFQRTVQLNPGHHPAEAPR